MQNLPAEVSQLHGLIESELGNGEGIRNTPGICSVNTVNVLPHRHRAGAEELREDCRRVVRATALQSRGPARGRAADETSDDHERRLGSARGSELLLPPALEQGRSFLPEWHDRIDGLALLAEASVRLGDDEDIARVQPLAGLARELEVGGERLGGPDLAEACHEFEHLRGHATHQFHRCEHRQDAISVVSDVSDDGVGEFRLARHELQEDVDLSLCSGLHLLLGLGRVQDGGRNHGDQLIGHAAACGDNGRGRHVVAVGAVAVGLGAQELAADLVERGVVEGGAAELVDLPRTGVLPPSLLDLGGLARLGGCGHGEPGRLLGRTPRWAP
mmetsp:Transcript_172707/g.553559  ORF Transcript_172707/g.553559 Transcript_172707/m.553559 type:complete len:330 (+) Transcript_172707:2019-3008(+)